MRKSISIFTLLLILTGLVQAADPVAEYRFNTGGGDTAYDARGSNDGDIKDGEWTRGIFGGAINFKDGGDQVVVGDDDRIHLDGEDFTLTSWVKAPPQGTHRFVYQKWRPNIYLGTNDNSWNFELQDQNGHQPVSLSAPTDGETWYFTAHTVNQTDEHCAYIYSLDGGLVDSSCTSIGTTEGSDGSSLLLGESGWHSNNNEYFLGEMDEFSVYKEHFSKEAIDSLYNNGAWRMRRQSQNRSHNQVLDMTFQHRNGSHVLDSSPEQNHGEPVNNPSQANAFNCKVGRCYTFNESGGGGSGQYIDVDNPSGLNNQEEITAMAWIKPKPSQDSRSPIMRIDRFYFQHYNDNKLATYWYGWNDNGYHYSSDNSVPTGEWSHVAVTWNQTDGVTFYVNGRKDTRISNAGTGDPLDWIKIGQEGSGRRFHGRIDQVKVFNHSLSQAEIIDEAEGLSADGGVLHSSFTEPHGDRVRDESVHDNHGRMQPGEASGPSITTGVTDNALRFNESNYVSVADDTTLDQGTSDFSIFTWVKRDQAETDGGGLVAKVGSGYQFVLNGNNYPKLRLYNGSYKQVTADTKLPAESWHHVGVVADRDKDATFYLDGEKIGEKDISAKETADLSSSRDVWIGYDAWLGRSTDQYFNGKLDEVRIYPYKASERAVKSLYQRETPQTTSPQATSSNLRFYHKLNTVETCGQPDTTSCPSGMNGDISIDSSGDANHGELFNQPEQVTAEDCSQGHCLTFDSDAYINSSKGYTSFDELTMSLWARFDSGVDDFQFPLNSAPEAKWRMGIDSSNDLYFDPGVHNDQNVGQTLNPEQWYHYVVTAQNTGNGSTFKVFLDGEKVDEGSLDKPVQNVSSVYLGRNPGHYSFQGELDQVRIYNESLTHRDVWELHSKGSGDHTVPKPVGHWRFDAGPRICIYNGAYSGGGWGAPSSSSLNSLLQDEGWETELVKVGDLTEDGWKDCDVIVNPDGEHMPGFDKSANFCNDVNGEGTEHDVFIEMQEFMDNGGLWVGPWGANIHDVFAYNGTWQNYGFDCPQYSGDKTYESAGGSRCSDIGYDCWKSGTYNYTNINQSIMPGLPSTVTSAGESDRWASNLDINLFQAYDGSALSSRYTGLERVGDGWYLHPGSTTLFNPGSYDNAGDAWNNLLTWYAGNGDQQFWDVASNKTGTISGGGNAPVYADGPRNTGVGFDGDDDGINVGDPSGVRLNGSLSICFWINPDDFEAQRENPIDKAYGGAFSFTLEDESDARLSTYFGSTGSDSGPYATNRWKNVVENGDWSHLCWVRDNAEQDVTLYKDGQDWSAYQTTSGWEPPVQGNNPVKIGDGYTNTFDGQLDDVRIYPYPLTEDEVNTVMSRGAGGGGSGY